VPITISFDIDESTVHDSSDRARIKLAFERLHWKNVGGSTWRYPALGTEQGLEDWMNHVVPALMCFRSYVEFRGLKVKSFSISAHTDTGFGTNPAVGKQILKSDEIDMYDTTNTEASRLNERRLRKFVKDAADSVKPRTTGGSADPDSVDETSE